MHAHHMLIYLRITTYLQRGIMPGVTVLDGRARWKLMGEEECRRAEDDGVLYVLAGFWDSAKKRAGMVDWMRSKQWDGGQVDERTIEAGNRLVACWVNRLVASWEQPMASQN